MKRILLAIGLVTLVSVGLSAVENSQTFFPLVQSSTFTGRVQYILAQEAQVIQIEAVAYTPAGGDTHPSTAVCHTLRAALAVKVAGNPAVYAGGFAVFLSTNINVTSAGALTGTGLTLDTPATDAALLAAVAGLWSSVAGCVTNP